MTTGLLNPSHVAIVLMIALLILGAKHVPQTGRALGLGMREFKDGITGRHDTSTHAQPPSLPATRNRHRETTTTSSD
jgi:sec-independent protein translocase protein TatA